MARDKYLARVGLNYPPNNKPPAVRREPGDVVDDLPPGAIAGMLEIGAIEGPLSAKQLAELPPRTGGVIPPGARTHIVGEQGPELVDLPEGAKVVAP